MLRRAGDVGSQDERGGLPGAWAQGREKAANGSGRGRASVGFLVYFLETTLPEISKGGQRA